MKEKKKSFYKESTKRLRDENIRIAEARERKIETSKDEKKLGLTAEEIGKKLKPRLTKVKTTEKARPFMVLKDQESLLIERDDELVEAVNKTYIKESKYGDSLKEKGDYKRTSMKFTHVNYCPREVYYEFFEPERSRPYTVKGLILFDDGKRHHKNIQNRLEEMGVLRGSEGYLNIPEINANGFYDGLIPIERQNGWLVCDILEVKTKLPYACNTVKQGDYDQSQLYHFGSKLSPALKASKIRTRNLRIFYKDRALETDEIHFGWIAKPDPDRQVDIMEYMRFLWNVVVGEKLLCPHPYEKKSKKCQYCRFKDWCWREYPDQTVEQVSMEIELPEKEILDSYAQKLYGILKKENELKAEKDKIADVLIQYFMKTKTDVYPIKGEEGLAPKQGKTTIWDCEYLRKNLGPELYAKISEPKQGLVSDLVHREFVDAAIFEKAKKYKPKKLSIYIKKIKGGVNADT